MLKTIRQNQRGCLILVAIVVVIAFSFLPGIDLDLSGGTVGKNTCVMKVDGRCYQDNEIVKLFRYQQLASNFISMRGFVQSLSSMPSRQPGTESAVYADQNTNFIANLLVLRKLGKELQVEPSAAEIRAAAKDLFFFNPNQSTLEEQLSNIGLREADFSRLVSDFVIYNNLRSLIGAGVQPNAKEAENFYILRNRRYSASKISFLKEDYKDEVKISDERVKEYFDERNGQPTPAPSGDIAEQSNPDSIALKPLMTQETRSFDYIRFSPQTLEENATEEQKRLSEITFTKLVNSVYGKLIERKDDFVAAAEQETKIGHTNDISVKEFTDISRDNLPIDLADQPQIYFELFKETMQIGDVSIPFKNNEGNYFIVQLKKIGAPRAMTFEEAKPEIIKILEAKEIDKIVADAASEAKTKLQEALKAGKSITEAAAENNLKIEALPEFSAIDQPEELEDAGQILESVNELSPGEVSAVSNLSAGKGTFLTYVDDITIYANDKKDEEIKQISEQSATSEASNIFSLWFIEEIKKANPEYVYSMRSVVSRSR